MRKSLKPSQIFWNTQSTMNNQYPSSQSLHASEEGLQNYYKTLQDYFLFHISQEARTIIDFGAGMGNFALAIKTKTGIDVDCVEIDPNHIRILKSKNLNVATNILELNKKVDVIYSKDVLEHINDDSSTLKELSQAMHSNSTLIIYVPAKPSIFSDLDRHVGHFRRYSRKDLVSKLQEAGFTTVSWEYVDSLGYLVGLMLRFIVRKSTPKLMSEKSFMLYDSIIFPISKFLDKLGLKKLFGKNLLVVAKFNPTVLK